MQAHIQLFVVIQLTLVLGGCAQNLPPLDFTPTNVGPSQSKINAELKSITVTVAPPEQATGQLDWAAETITGHWKNALQNSLDRYAIFQDRAPKTVSVSVKILKYDYPEFGAEMVTSTAARYEIINRSDGGLIFTQDIETKGVVPAGFAFVGSIRSRESASRSVRNNIAQFLQALETVDITKPMFPAKKHVPTQKQKLSPKSSIRPTS